MDVCSMNWALPVYGHAAAPFGGRWTRRCSRCRSFWNLARAVTSYTSLLLRWLCGLVFTCRRHDPLQSQIGHHVPIVLIRVRRIDREQRQLRYVEVEEFRPIWLPFASVMLSNALLQYATPSLSAATRSAFDVFVFSMSFAAFASPMACEQNMYEASATWPTSWPNVRTSCVGLKE